MNKNDGGPAFPHCQVEGYEPGDGMSLRDYFAAAFIVGADEITQQMGETLLKKQCPTWEPGNTMESVRWWAESEAAYRYLKADAMLKARSQ